MSPIYKHCSCNTFHDPVDVWDPIFKDDVKPVLKIDKADEIQAIEALAECGILTPVYQDGVFYTDADGAVYVL